jgi:hypothetical protein
MDYIWSRENSVLIGTGYGSNPSKSKIFPFSIASRPAMGSIYSPIPWLSDILSLEVKRLGREADHSPPSRDEFKIGGAITPLLRMFLCRGA